MNKIVLPLIVGGFVVFWGVGFGFTTQITTVGAYPFQGCISSGHTGYVDKGIADSSIGLSNKGVLVDTSEYPIVYTCITIDRSTTVYVDPNDIDDRGLADSGESNCIDCIAGWE